MLVSESAYATSYSLVSRVRARDAEAWRRFAELYGPLVYGWVRRAGFQPTDASDLVQEVFHHILNGIGGFRPDGATATFRRWLWTITRNEIHLSFRRREGQAVAEGGTDCQDRLHAVADWLESETEPDEEASSARLARRALQLVERDFDPQVWQAFWRTTMDGTSSTDVATDLGMTPNAVRQAKYRVLARLKEELGGE